MKYSAFGRIDKMIIKKLPKISLSPQQATKYSPRNFSLSATSNFSLSKSATASCGVLNPDLEINNFYHNNFPVFRVGGGITIN